MMKLLQYTIVNKLNVYAQKFTVQTIIVMCFLIFISTRLAAKLRKFQTWHNTSILYISSECCRTTGYSRSRLETKCCFTTIAGRLAARCRLAKGDIFFMLTYVSLYGYHDSNQWNHMLWQLRLWFITFCVCVKGWRCNTEKVCTVVSMTALLVKQSHLNQRCALKVRLNARKFIGAFVWDG